MTGVPEQFLELLSRMPGRFSRADLQKAAPNLREGTVSVYLSNLAREGVVARIGPNLFERIVVEPTSQLHPRIQSLALTLHGRFLPSLMARTIWWSDEDLAPFMSDAIQLPFVVVETPPSALETVANLLSASSEVTLVRGRASLSAAIWRKRERSMRPATQLFATTTTDLAGTVPTEEGVRMPGIERLFVEALHFHHLVPDVPLSMLQTPGFSVRLALRLAGSRGETGQAAAFLTWAALADSRQPLRPQILKEFPFLESAGPA